MSPFVPMASTALIVVIVIVVVTVAIYQLRVYVLEKQRQKALKYLLTMTKLRYFYGYSVSECLQASMAEELYLRDVGDFAKQLGALVLSALSSSGVENEPGMHCEWHEDPESSREGHYEVTIIFAYRNKWWQFDLLQKVDADNLQRMRPDHDIVKNSIGQIKYPSLWLDGDYKCLQFWWLKKAERHNLDNCASPKTSALLPNARYVTMKSDLEYKELVRYKVEQVMDAWYFRNKRNEPQEDFGLEKFDI